MNAKAYPVFVFWFTFGIYLALSSFSHAYNPPLGIKNPQWGSIHPIDIQSPSWPLGWPSQEVVGYYYYDNSTSYCSDSNIYGYPDKPRCSFPSTMTYAAGSYVEIHGGSYIHDGTQIFVFHGTETNPIWFRGASVEDRPTLGGSTVFNGSYAFIENIYMTQRNDRFIHIRVGANTGPGPYYGDHLSFRHIEIEGDSHEVSTGHSAFGVSGNSSSEITDNIVFYDVNIHHIGSVSQASVDYHGFKIAEFAKNIWILDSDIHHLQGDSIQVGSYYHTEEDRPHHVWVGGNILHENAENAFDVKNAWDLILASNDMYGFYSGDSTAGNAVGIRSYNSRVGNIWIINNKIHHANIGIKSQNVDNVYILGNLIHDISTGDGTEYMDGIVLFNTNNHDVLVGNVINSEEYGLALNSGGNHTWDIRYNYFLRSGKRDIIYENRGADNLDHNKFSDFSVIWSDHRYSSLWEFQSEENLCTHCVTGSQADVDLSITPRNNVVSPVTKESLVHFAYTDFENFYNINLRQAFSEKPSILKKPDPEHPRVTSPTPPSVILLLIGR